MIRELDERALERLFEEELCHDFPEAEIKPLELMKRLMSEGRYRVLGSFEEDRLCAYALLVRERESSVYLLDFFAVVRGGRDSGRGSRFLREVFEAAGASLLILEVEDVLRAADEEERRMRERRMAFYHRNGVRDTGLYTEQFGVGMRILYLAEQDLGEERDGTVYRELDAIYRFVFGELYGDEPVRLSRG